MRINWKVIGIILLVFSGIVLLTFLVFWGFQSAGIIGKSPNITITGTVDEDAREIEKLKTMLKDEKLDAQSRQSLEKKLRMAEDAAQLRAQVQADTPKTSATVVPKPIQGGDTTFPKGIFDGDAATFRPEDVLIQNRWQGVINETFFIVFAGRLASDEKQGIIIVRRTSVDRKTTKYDRYNAPGQTGNLKILSENDRVLTVQTIKGDILTFNLDSFLYK